MFQLALVHGDLMLGTDGSYLTVTGSDRIRQDLTLALNDVYGTDRFHPNWGSIVAQYLGSVNTAEVQTLVKAEINRVLQNYLIIQQQGVIQSSMLNIVGQYDTSDVVRSVDNIQAQTLQDAIYVSATLTTVAGQTITISQKVSQ